MTTPEEFRALLDSPEGSRVEFKAASGGFHFEVLVKNCVALAEEGGGGIYRFLGKPGVYTRRRGLDREANKALLLKHIEDAHPQGCAMAELQQVLPALGRRAILVLLDDLRSEGRVRVEGKTRGARWFAISKGQTREMR